MNTIGLNFLAAIGLAGFLIGSEAQAFTMGDRDALGNHPTQSDEPLHTQATTPNILFIFADDWGWGDLSCHGHPYVKTPNIDRLAKEGTDFYRFTVASGVCSPSRTAVTIWKKKTCRKSTQRSLKICFSRSKPERKLFPPNRSARLFKVA